jgi:hypothetical protein
VSLERHAILAIDRHPDFPCGLELSVDDAGVRARRVKEKTIKAVEITGQSKLRLVGLDAVDGG